jgi:ATP-binding cassette subfamily B protein
MLSTLTQQIHSWRGRIRALRNLPPILKLVWNSGPLLTFTGVVLRLVTALVPVASLWVGKLIIDRVVSSIRTPAGVPGDIWILLTCELLLVAAGNVFGRAIDYCDVRLTDEFTREVSLRIMRHASKLDLQSFEDPLFNDKLDRARAQATDRLGMLSGIGRLLQQTITLVSLAAGVIAYSPQLFLLLVLCVIPAFLGESHFAFVGYNLAHFLTPMRRELDYLRVLGTSKESAKEVKVFGLGDHLRNRFHQLTGTIIEENKSLSRRRLVWGSLLSILGSIGYYAAYALLVFRAIHGQMSVGDLTFLGGSLLGCANQISMLFSTFASIADQALFLTDLVEFFAVRPRIRSRANALPAPRPMRTGYEFRNVCFSYPGSSRLILNNINFRIETGERIALVGENGQGKTTLVKLLSRLYDPTSGVILLDGVDLRDYDVDDLHREIGVIFQDFMRYDLSARENIGVGRIDQVHDDVLLWEAARKSGAHDVLVKLPGGLDQILGRRFEGGVDLSGGEWQKFALARAYLRDSQVLILDEPTSSLDAAAEYEVFENFAELTRERTALFISHRLSTVRMADRIVVIENGNVGEQGTHQQLIDSGGQYARLFEMQAASYR